MSNSRTCPQCSGNDTVVVDRRGDKRRILCLKCDIRWNTIESVDLNVKPTKTIRRVNFDNLTPKQKEEFRALRKKGIPSKEVRKILNIEVKPNERRRYSISKHLKEAD